MVHIVSRSLARALVGAAALTLGLWAGTAAAEPRVALVIGNSAYHGDLPALPNPANDAKLMAKTLKGVGFDVIEAEDASQADMKTAIAAFGDKLTAAGAQATGLFFYAGHGLQVAGENYLIPVDAEIKKEADVDLAAVSATSVMKQMDFAGSAVNIVILDACRNNPLSDGARGITRGLAEIKSSPRGSFIAYSTAPGSTAADGDGANSPYTMALASTITEPGLSIGDVFQEVRTKVLAATGNAQTPWDSSSLTGRFYFTPAQQTASVTQPAAQQPAAPAATATVGASVLEQTYWDSIKDSNDPAEFEAYLNKFPNGFYNDLAKIRINKLKQDTQVASVTPNANASPAANDGRTVQPPQPAQPAAVTFIATPGQKLYAKGGGQVRAAPDGHSQQLAKLQPNTEIEATGHSDDGKWWRVNFDGQTAYMHASVVSEQPAQVAANQPAVDGFAAQGGSGGGAAANPNSIQMINGGAAAMEQPAPVATNQPAANAQAAGQLASAVQSGSLGQAASALAGLLGNGGSQQQSMPAPQQITFQEINRPVVLRAGAIILNAPNGQPIARTTADTQLMARGTAGNWLQVQLPNMMVGVVSANYVKR